MSNTVYLSDLTARLNSNRLALFIGGDLPRVITGIPSRRDLAAGLARQAGQPEPGSLASVAQRVSRGGNRYDFTDYLIRELDTIGKNPQPFHHLAASLPVKHFITTGYDDMLRRAFDAADRPVNYLLRSSQLAFRNPSWPNLFQLYGLISQPETLVVTEDDHLQLWRDPNKAQLLDRIRPIFEENAILFVGYDLSDPDFKLLWREVLDRMGQFTIGAYATAPSLPPGEREVWEDRRVRILDAEPLAILEQLAGVVDAAADASDKTSVKQGTPLREMPKPARIPIEKQSAQIFLSYAREDEDKVDDIYRKLSRAGFKPWMDTYDLLPGEQWKSSIKKAIQDSDFFLACLSNRSVKKRSYLQREFREALDLWQEKMESDIYLIPVRLDDCEVPDILSDFHWVNMYESDGWTRLEKAIQEGMKRRSD
jgi:hypothetical protein